MFRFTAFASLIFLSIFAHAHEKEVCIDTIGNAITLANNNTISGFVIDSATHDAIYGANLESLDVCYYTFKKNNYLFNREGICLTNNQLLNNVNSIFLTLNVASYG